MQKSLNANAETIAYKLGDQFNYTLRESIKDDLIVYRAKFLRDDADRNSISEVHTSQSLILEFEIVNLFKELGADFSCVSAICDDTLLQDKYQILKSKKPVPLPIRLKQSGKNPFLYLGRADGSKSFNYVTLDKYTYIKYLPYSSKTIYYTIINNHVYIINNLNDCDINETLGICNVLVKGIFENPRDFYNACKDNTFIDDKPFPIGEDMLMQIRRSIIEEYQREPKNGEEINIKQNDAN